MESVHKVSACLRFLVLVFIDSLNALGLCCEICWDTYVNLEISVKVLWQ